MDHKEARDVGAVERYLLGELDDDARAAFEEHFFACRECGEDVRLGAILMANARPQLIDEPPARVSLRPARRRDESWRAWFWPVPVGALAASLAVLTLAAYQTFVAMPHLRRDVAATEQIRAVTWTFLSVSRNAPQIVTVSRSQRHLGLTLSRSSAEAHTYFHCSLSRADGRTVLSSVVTAPPSGEELQLLLPLTLLSPGDYVLVVSAMASETTSAADQEAARYHFTLRYQEGGQ